MGNSEERYEPPKCHPKTRNTDVFWLNGPAGAGKSAIAQTIAEKCHEQGLLAGSFFFSRSVPDRNVSSRFIAIIAYQLLIAYPLIADRIARAIEEDPSIINRSLEYQAEALIMEPFRSPDGLDECLDETHQCRILRILARFARDQNLPFSFSIPSRPEPHIVDEFAAPDIASISLSLSLHNVKSTSRDIRTYLESGFASIHSSPTHRHTMQDVPAPWPTQNIIEIIVKRSSDQFIYASTVLRFVDDPDGGSPVEQLKIVLNVRHKSKPFAALDAIYSEILSRIRSKEQTLNILGCLISISQEDQNRLHQCTPPLLFTEKVLSLRSYGVYYALRQVHSLVYVARPGSDLYYTKSDGYRFFHSSFQEFLTDQDRSRQDYINIQQIHTMMSIAMVRNLSTFDFRRSSCDYVSLVLFIQHVHEYLVRSNRESEDLYYALSGFNLSSNWIDCLDLWFPEIDLARLKSALIRSGGFPTLKNESRDVVKKEWYSLASKLISEVSHQVRGLTFLSPRNGDILNYHAKYESALDRYFHRKLAPFLPVSKEDIVCLGLVAFQVGRRPGEMSLPLVGRAEDMFSRFIAALSPLINWDVGYCFTDTLIDFLFDQRRAGQFCITSNIRASVVVLLLEYLDNEYICLDDSKSSMHRSLYTLQFTWGYHDYWTRLIEDANPTRELITMLRIITHRLQEMATLRYVTFRHEHDIVLRIVKWLKNNETASSEMQNLLKFWTSHPLWDERGWGSYKSNSGSVVNQAMISLCARKNDLLHLILKCFHRKGIKYHLGV